MFDAKTLLEGIVRNAIQPAGGGQSGAGSSGGGLADILGQVLQGGGTQGDGQPSGGGLSDILGQLQRNLEGAGGGARNAVEQPSSGMGGQGGGIGDILNQIKDQLGQSGGAMQGGGVLDALGKVLGQATQGVKEGAGRIDSATGASGAFREALQNATGRNPDDILAQLQKIVRDNPLAAGGALGGLGGLVLGTKTGRSLAGSAARLGALALIGGLAYKAVQNYQSGKPILSGATPIEAPPQGSGFEPAAISNQAAALYIRAMIAAAAADGRIDAGEQSRIIDGLKQAGVDAEAEAFLADAFNNPVSIAQLASAVSSKEEAVQVYAAARIAVDPDTGAERNFLAQLANALGIEPELARHIDATARSAA